MQYKLDEGPIPVMLDTGSLQRSCVLLLDTFFRVLVWHGTDIAVWRNAGYQEQPEYANLKVLLEAPLAEACALIKERFPPPILIVCDQDSGLARSLLAMQPIHAELWRTHGKGKRQPRKGRAVTRKVRRTIEGGRRE